MPPLKSDAHSPRGIPPIYVAGTGPVLQKSSGVEQALELLADHLRNMMVISACGGEAAFLDLSEEHMHAAKKQAASFDAPALVHMIALCDAVTRNARGSATARSLFDAALVRLSMSRNFADVGAQRHSVPGWRDRDQFSGAGRMQDAGGRVDGETVAEHPLRKYRVRHFLEGHGPSGER